ncbi:hypothetical protein TorRG33x02_306750 [Trema orientale]|uniref:Uncharacterized protein n=1 Tax=Trema orientale TaxID=63057 RepID=A0A2P5BW15_TREOI|nr:hypothetical protein TorRG33x02_306750 [Trema orientale]
MHFFFTFTEKVGENCNLSNMIRRELSNINTFVQSKPSIMGLDKGVLCPHTYFYYVLKDYLLLLRRLNLKVNCWVCNVGEVVPELVTYSLLTTLLCSLELVERIVLLLEVFSQHMKKLRGQRINFTKSAITFSPNVCDTARRVTLEMLGLQNSNSHDSYLGLPTVIGKNKKKTLSSIKERVWKKVQGWHRGLFSAGGREVLIKADLQTVPNYVMSVFKLPTTFCNELKSIFLRF